MKLADCFALAGLLLLGGSLWALHPAATCGFAGVVLIACGVHLAKAKAKDKTR